MSTTATTKSPTTDLEEGEDHYNKHAWKYIGYPEFCEFSAIDDDFLVFRRFGTLNIRTLLDVQFQITALEIQLHRLDQACKDDPDLNNAASRMDSLAWDNCHQNGKQRRGELVRELQPLLHKYSKSDC